MAVVAAVAGCGGGDDGGATASSADEVTEPAPTAPEGPTSTAPADTGPGSVTDLVGRAAHDPDADLPLARYFSLERYREGTDLPEGLEGEELVDAVFFEGMADGLPASPHGELLETRRTEPGVLPPEGLVASYEDLSVDGTLLVGEWDPEAVVGGYAEVVGPVEEVEVDGFRVVRAADPGTGGADGSSGDVITAGLYARSAVAVAPDGSEVVFGAEGDGTDAVADDEAGTALSVAGVAEVAEALDAAGAYSAALFVEVGEPGQEGPLPETWTTGAVATAVDEDGGSRAYTVLWQEDAAAAEANADALVDVVEGTEDCVDPATAEVHGALLVVSCAHGGRWVTDVVARYPLGPLFS